MIVHVKISDTKGDETLFDEYMEIPDTGRFSNIINSLSYAENKLLFDNELFEKYGGNE